MPYLQIQRSWEAAEVTYPGVLTHNELWQRIRCNLHKNTLLCVIYILLSSHDKTQNDEGSNSSAKVVKNNLITMKLHSKEQHHHREQSLCIGFSPSLFTLRGNGAFVAATVTTCGFLGNTDQSGNATLSPIGDCSDCPLLVQSTFSAACRPQQGPQWLGNNPSVNLLSHTKTQSLGTVKQQRPMTCVHSNSQ